MDKKITSAELSAFCSEVALMLGAGMQLYDGLETLAETYADTPAAEMYRKVSENVTQTGSLYEALKTDPRWPKHMVEMTGVGERTGRLEEVMNGLSAYYERENRIRSAVVSAVTYPIVLGIMMLLIVFIMIVQVLPVFQRVLNSMGVAMTAGGSVMMNIGTTVGWAVMVLVGLILIAIIAVVLLLRTSKREAVLAGLRKIFPPVRRLMTKLSASRVASVLSMMLSSGFPLEDALDMVAPVLNDSEAVNEVNGIKKKMEGGATFGDALTGCTLFDEMHRRMIRMGTSTGREDQVMERIAHTYEEQVEDGISNLVSIIEPSLVALLCVVIGAILLSVMLPMAGIISSIL